jgi:hypothetical protein
MTVFHFLIEQGQFNEPVREAGSIEIPNVPSINDFIKATAGNAYKKAAYTAQLRGEGKGMALRWLNTGGRPLGRTVLVVEVRRSNRIRRDVHNVYIKPYIDGFVDAGVWPDDSEQWLPTVVFHYSGIFQDESTIFHLLEIVDVEERVKI